VTPEQEHGDGVILPFGRRGQDRPDGAVLPGDQPGPDAELVGPVFEGEIVEDGPGGAVEARRPRLPVRARRADLPVPVPAAVARGAARHGWTVAAGVSSWAARAWDAATHGVYRRQVKAAEAAGDQQLLVAWTDRRAAEAERRHRRLMDLPALAAGLAKAGAAGLVAALVAVLLVAVLAQVTGAGRFTGVFHGVGTAIRVGFGVAAVAWTAAVFGGPVLLLAAAWREGRRRGAAPRWLATAADTTDIEIDETTIARALQALRIPQVNDYLKAGVPLQYLTPARRDGRGTHAVVRLPYGVTAEKIARRRADLATGLHRAAKEVWPTTGAEAGVLDLWIADKGALAEGAGPYPLLVTGSVDVFRGVPFGRTLRGDPVAAPLFERNTIAGGMPGQGKSSAARVILAGAALDPRVEIRIYVPDSNFDFEAFKPRCSRYVMGAEDEKIVEILHDLRALKAEVQARGELLVRHRAESAGPQLAGAGVGLHPLLVALEEAHVLFQHKTYGEELSELACDIVKLGRKRFVHLLVSTQAPTAGSIPRDVTRNCSNGIAFAVGDHVANDALLGQGAYSAGHRATELIPGTDIGTAVCKGFSGQRSDIVQVYFVAIGSGHDQITPIIKRALAAIADRGRGVPGAGQARPAPAPRDLLADLDAVLAEDPVPIAGVPALLRRHAPGWGPYGSLNGKALRQLLATEHDIQVPSTGNRYPLDPAAVRDAIARRHDDDPG
jgi:S-DNA-T family DNA segregation ATPase FtsK/SpoIIIE